MKKEVFLAVSVGFVLGLIITFGIWTANNSLKNHPQVNVTAGNLTPSPTLAPASGGQTNPIPLSLTSPETDETLVNTDSLTVSGKTVPGAVVAITYETGENILAADKDGNFSLDIKLEGGYNRITAAAYDKDGNTAVVHTLVTYSTSKI